LSVGDALRKLRPSASALPTGRVLILRLLTDGAATLEL
jgi:hypothetical protein